MNFFENPDDLVDQLYSWYPEMDGFNTQERTEAASHLITDFLFASQAYNEAHNHAQYFTIHYYERLEAQILQKLHT